MNLRTIMTNTPEPQDNTLDELVDSICLRDKSLVVPAVKKQIQALITEARIDEVKKALSFTTMRDLENRYFYLVDSTGGTPFKQKFVSKAQLKENK